MQEDLKAKFGNLVTIMDDLREKCPWDKEQTIHTLRQMTIEELYEFTDSVAKEDWDGMREELGDLLLHILFYAKIGQEKGKFTLQEIVQGISEKLIRRHPHIYPQATIDGLQEVKTAEEVKANWQKIKKSEGSSSFLKGVPESLPPIYKAMRLQAKAKEVGFEWENAVQVWAKVEEELTELKTAVYNNDAKNMEEELGDVFFSLINYARFLQIDADKALENCNQKFLHRFKAMEAMAVEDGIDFLGLSLVEKDKLWDAVKANDGKKHSK